MLNQDNVSSFKSPICHDGNDTAIRCNSLRGACFGSGHDLFISHNANTNYNSCSNFGNTYQPPPGYEPDTPQTNALLAGSEKFQPSEIEVFRS